MKSYHIKLSTSASGGIYKKWFCTRLTPKQYAKIAEANGGEIESFSQWKKFTDGDALLPLDGFEAEYDDFVLAGFTDDAEVMVEDENGNEVCKGLQYFDPENDEYEDLDENLPVCVRDIECYDGEVGMIEAQVALTRDNNEILFLQELATKQSFKEDEAFEQRFTLELEDDEPFEPTKLRLRGIEDFSDGVLLLNTLTYNGKPLESDDEPDSFDYESFGKMDKRINAKERPNACYDEAWGFDWINDGEN